MFGNKGKKFIISLPKQTKSHSEQMSLSLLIVAFTILSSLSVDGRRCLEDCRVSSINESNESMSDES